MVWQKTLQVGGETDHLIDGGRRLNSRTCQLAADLWLIFFWVKELFSVQCSRGRSHRTGKLWPKNGWFFRGAPLCQQQILKDNIFKSYEVDKLEGWLEGKSPKVKKKREGLNLKSEMSSISNETHLFQPRLGLCHLFLDEVSAQVPQILPSPIERLKEWCNWATKFFLWAKTNPHVLSLKNYLICSSLCSLLQKVCVCVCVHYCKNIWHSFIFFGAGLRISEDRISEWSLRKLWYRFYVLLQSPYWPKVKLSLH